MGAPRKTAVPTVVNGINVDDLFALIDNVKRETAKGKTNWHVTTTWQGQARSRARSLPCAAIACPRKRCAGRDR